MNSTKGAPAPLPPSTRILVVEDHQMMRDGLLLMLRTYPGVEAVGACGDSATALRLAGELRPDLVLVDVDLPDGSGIALTRRLRAAFPAVKVMVLTGHLERTFAIEAINAGAHGYLAKTKSSDELLDAVRTIMAGGIYLRTEVAAVVEPNLAASPKPGAAGHGLPAREGQVLGLILRGLRNKEIAAELHVGIKTVETYRSRLMKRYGCTSPAELVRHAIRVGLAIA